MAYFKISLKQYRTETCYQNVIFTGETVYVQSGKEDLPDGSARVSEKEFNKIAVSLEADGADK